ncbi:MAG: hypothetical protein GF364_09105 [Candidatus Lokiarchaeota archaeon]|nr:hypothetical protein [Candidatus Lokiarchaeota archaeon]
MPELIYRISGLSDFTISFENFCVPCKWQRRCRYGKKAPLNVIIGCNDLLEAYNEKRLEQMRRLQKEADIEDSYEDIESRMNINLQQIFSGIWKKMIKDHKEEILCINSRKMDTMVTSQRGAVWWQEFSKIMRKIYEECKKQVTIKE